MATERAFVAQPVLTAGGRVIASPFQFYVTGEDRLRVRSINSLTGVRLKVQCRFITLDNVIQANSWDHTPAADRTVQTDDYELGRGAVLNVAVFATGATPLMGQTFVIVQLVRGVGAAAIVLGTLLQGYVTSVQSLGWPGSPIISSIEDGGYVRHLQGTDPFPGGEISEVVPIGARWHVLTVTATLSTGAAPGTRTPQLRFRDVGVAFFASTQPVGTGPLASTTYCWSVGMPLVVQVGSVGSAAGLMTPNRLLANQEFATVTQNFAPADDWSAPSYQIEEWLEVS